MATNKKYEIVVPQKDYLFMTEQFDNGIKELNVEGLDGVTRIVRKNGVMTEIETGRVVHGSHYLFEQACNNNTVVSPNTALGYIFCLGALQNGYLLVEADGGIRLKRK